MPQPIPIEPVLPIDNVQQLLTNALTDAGIVGIDEAIEQPYINRAFFQLNSLIAQWATMRFMNYRIQDYFVTATGATEYTVGNAQNININPRPDRLEYAFLRFLNSPPGNNLNVDIPLRIIQSHEDYSRITVKNIGTLPWAIFYDPSWPIGVLRPWPVPQSGIYQVHVGFRVVIPRFANVQDKVNLPPAYLIALNWSLVRRLRATYQLPPDQTIDALARSAVNAIRLSNQQVGVLQMPSALRNRNRAYDYRSDNAGQ